MKTRNRFLAVLLALCMALSLMTAALAEVAGPTKSSTEETGGVASGSEAPTPTPTTSPTPAPTKNAGKKPSNSGHSGGGYKAPAMHAMPTLNTVTEQFLSAVSTKLGITVTADAVTTSPDGSTVIALDKPNGIYGGSKLTSYNDNATYALASTYSAEAIALFDEWRMSADVQTSEKFSEFIKYAQVEMAVLLPDMTEEELSNMFAAVLISNTVGLELTAETVPAFWTEDTIALGMETLEGYVFYLLVQGNDIVLGVCEV